MLISHSEYLSCSWRVSLFLQSCIWPVEACCPPVEACCPPVGSGESNLAGHLVLGVLWRLDPVQLERYFACAAQVSPSSRLALTDLPAQAKPLLVILKYEIAESHKKYDLLQLLFQNSSLFSKLMM